MEASRQLEAAIASLDVPPDLQQRATTEYLEVAGWLSAAESPLRDYTPKLYPQGSFRLGTPIRPLSHEDEFDIDLVCELNILKQQTTQAALKELVGDRLKESARFFPKVEERRRCWTLRYPRQFHLDVLPTIPDVEHAGDGVLVTDRQLRLWQHSNPIGYAVWFYECMERILTEARRSLAKALNVEIEEIPEWRVRTPLQRSVQLLKRHRDMRFLGNLDRRPASIIITTLAGKSYQGEGDVATAVLGIIDRMESHVENRDGEWWIPNPAHDRENFADKWNEKPELRDAFLRWRDRVHEDLEALENASSEREVELLLEKSLHGKRERREVGLVSGLSREPIVPELASVSHRKAVPWPVRHQFGCAVGRRHRVASGGGRWRAGPGVLPKHADLEFTANTNAPEPYEVWWQVTNTGEEARRANQLRGEFERGEGTRGLTKKEATRYNGTHLVQAFVVKDGFLVASSEELRVRIGKN